MSTIRHVARVYAPDGTRVSGKLQHADRTELVKRAERAVRTFDDAACAAEQATGYHYKVLAIPRAR